MKIAMELICRDYDCRVCDKGPEDIGAWARVAVAMGEEGWGVGVVARVCKC